MHPHPWRLVRVRALVPAVVLLLVALNVVFTTAAHADTSVKLKLTINWIQQYENPDDDGGDGDYFPEIRIGHDGPLSRKGAVQDDVFDPSTFPDPWTFTHTTSVPDNATTLPILIRLWDEDGGTSGGDDKMDISPQNQDVDLDLLYDIGTDTWTGPGDLITPGQERITGDNDPNFPNSGDGKKATIGINIERESPLPDTDGDGIYDVIERFGVRNKDGSMLHDLKALGANPCRKSIVVQIDYMTGAADGHNHQPKEAAIEEVKDAFEDAPVAAAPTCPFPGFPSPQGVDFVHVQGAAIAEQAVMGLDNTFRAARTANFSPLLRPYAHYAIFGHDVAAGSDSSGVCCENTQGNKDFIATLGSWRTLCVAPGPNDVLDSTRTGDDVIVGTDIGVGPNRTCDSTRSGDDRQILAVGAGAADAEVGTVRDQSGTIMHELGHALGLGHGGGDRTNNKPNYLSVMNYSFDPGGIPTGPATEPRRLDYSRQALPSLDRTSLVEANGVGDGSDFTRWTGPGGGVLFGPATGPLNWNDNFQPDGTPIIDPNPVNLDINADDDICVQPGGNNTLNSTRMGDDVVTGQTILDGADGMCQSTPAMDDTGRDTVLTGFDDWQRLKYRAVGSPDAGPSAADPAPDEIGFTAVVRGENAFQDFYDPDLATAKTVDKPTALPGDTLTYSVKVDNVGKGRASKVKLTDTFPDDTTTTRSLPDLAPGASRIEPFTYLVPCTTANGTVLTNSATVEAKNVANGPEANTANNTGKATSAIKAPKLTLTAATTPAANAAEAVTTTLTATNTGGATATGAKLTYVLPQGVYYSTALDQGQGPKPTSVSGDTLTWQLGSVEAGATTTVRFTTRSSLLTTGGTELTGQAKLVYGNANGCVYEPVTASATSTVTEVAPSRNPQISTIWATLQHLRTAELLARVQATDTRFDGADGTAPDGRLSQQEASATLFLPLLQPKKLRSELLATYLNLGSRRINAATAVRTITIQRLGLDTVAEAARHAQTVLTLPPGGNVIRYTDATLALIEINSGIAERY